MSRLQHGYIERCTSLFDQYSERSHHSFRLIFSSSSPVKKYNFTDVTVDTILSTHA